MAKQYGRKMREWEVINRAGQKKNALEIKDQYLVQMVHRIEAGEMTIDHVYLE
jgi:hypothetical protein